MEYENKYRSRILIGVLIVLVGVLLAISIVLVSLGVREDKYQSIVKGADHYFEVGDYNNAIIEYENAIKIDKKKEGTYLKLASAYVYLGNYESALQTLERGLSILESGSLESKKQEIINYLYGYGQTVDSPLTDEKIEEYSTDVGVENNIFDMVASYTYTEYFRDYGKVAGINEGEKTILSYGKNGFKATYYNINGEKVIDGATKLPYANAKPVEVSFSSLRKVFSSGAEHFAVTYERLQEIFGNSLQMKIDENSGMHYIAAEYKKCRIYVETDENGNIVKENAWNRLEPVNRKGTEYEEGVEGEVKGYVQNALSGKGMKAELKVRDHGRKTGSVIKKITSNKDGSYTFGGKRGKYTIEASAKGYITEYLDVEIIDGQVKTANNIVLAPTAKEGEIRIVLTWGSHPMDLDSYAIGKSSNGTRFNINFTNKNVNDVGNLDVDDTSAYGPETVTITDTDSEFEYSVVDFREEGTMGGSEATVKVYLPGESTAVVYKVPSGSGILWNVFKYKDGELTKINKISSDVSGNEYYI